MLHRRLSRAGIRLDIKSVLMALWRSWINSPWAAAFRTFSVAEIKGGGITLKSSCRAFWKRIEMRVRYLVDIMSGLFNNAVN